MGGEAVFTWGQFLRRAVSQQSSQQLGQSLCLEGDLDCLSGHPQPLVPLRSTTLGKFWEQLVFLWNKLMVHQMTTAPTTAAVLEVSPILPISLFYPFYLYLFI